ncbi:MAG: CotH kinase family protein, partial [Muribaculaceae bacterium]|nr:CotH kinase family protein [Muribaculaceae bacterium]
MKRFVSGMICATVMTTVASVFPSTVYAQESEGNYPVFYLRGSDSSLGWSNTNMAFTRDNDNYSIHVDRLDGEFKISNDDWTINYGSDTGSVLEITTPVIVTGMGNGQNFKCSNLTDVKISFKYNPDSRSTAKIFFSINGVDPKEPSPADQASGTLPILYINFYNEDGSYNNEVISKDLSHKNYFAGEYWLDVNDCQWLIDLGATSVGSKEAPLPLEMKARGNYTRKAFSKKPFKLKLAAKQSLLGLSKSKHFAILAHADDFFGYMRNFTGFNLGRRIGLPWTPWQQPVEVIINGDYRGLYFLTESIRVEKDRVNINELDDNATDPALVSGGYLIELDNYDEENQIRMEEKGQAPGIKDALRITFDTPELYSDIQRKFVGDQFTAMNDAIGANSDVLWSYMDMDDAARYYIVEEIISHTESYHGSTYMFRDRGENQKWHFSPLWDCGNAFMGRTDDYFTRDGMFGNTWIASMRMNNKFMDKVKETWKWFMSNKFIGFYEELEAYANHLKAAANADYARWNGKPLPNFDSPQSVVDNRDMDARLSSVKNHLQAKTSWLRNQWGDHTTELFAEPERDTTLAAPLPEYITTGVSEIEGAIAEGYELEIYTLQGMKVSAVESGNIYIVRN